MAEKQKSEDINPEWEHGEGTSRKSSPNPQSRYEGPIAPVIISIVAVLAWAVFALLYALYWSAHFSLFQSVIVIIFSLIITGLLIGLMWVIISPRGTWRGK